VELETANKLVEAIAVRVKESKVLLDSQHHQLQVELQKQQQLEKALNHNHSARFKKESGSVHGGFECDDELMPLNTLWADYVLGLGWRGYGRGH
jgi:hypothetical protein